jgi:putative addiction module component (TIGR02574 family)
MMREAIMTEAVKQLQSQAGALSAAERAELAYFLLTSLEPEEEGVAEAWRAEIARRVTEIRSGQAIGRPIDEVLAELREQFP